MTQAQGPQQRPRLVLQALDTNHDGNLSPQEIQSAPDSLRTLDLNSDGQLSFSDELSPRRTDAGADPNLLVEQLMKFDRNGDGVLTADELPERMSSLLNRADLNKDGKLTPDEIRQSAARSTTPHGHENGNSAEAAGLMHLDPLIDALDADHDGVITAEEMKDASQHLLALDKNHDGSISPDEMRMRPQSPAQRAAHALGEFDSNHDDKLSREEVPDGLRARFDEADKNGDGLLDKTELEQMFATMPAGGPRRNSENNAAPDAQQPKGPNN